MYKAKLSKKTGSMQWVMVRVSGVVLLILLLAHFWVHHFFIKEFYGEVNILDQKPGQKTLMSSLPFVGGDESLLIAPVLNELKNTPHYLRADDVKGPTTVTVIRAHQRTDMIQGAIRDRMRLSDVLGRDVSREATLDVLTVSPKQLKTERMINFSDVHARVGGSTWIWWKAYNLLFLVLGLYHGLIGVWDIIIDYKMNSVTRMGLYGAVWTLGLILFLVGVLIIVPM